MNNNSKTINLRIELDKKVNAYLKMIATEKGMNKTDFIVKLLEEYVESNKNIIAWLNTQHTSNNQKTTKDQWLSITTTS